MTYGRDFGPCFLIVLDHLDINRPCGWASIKTVQVSAVRHVQAAIWHGHPVPLSTTVPPLSVALCLFSCVLGVSYLGSFISLGTYIIVSNSYLLILNLVN